MLGKEDVMAGSRIDWSRPRGPLRSWLVEPPLFTSLRFGTIFSSPSRLFLPQDLPAALGSEELAVQLEVQDLKNRLYMVKPVCASDGSVNQGTAFLHSLF